MIPVRAKTGFYYVYILSFDDGKRYTGCTSDLRARFNQHKDGLVQSTKNRIGCQLIYYEACLHKSDAYAREKYLKTGMGKRYVNNRLKHALALTG